MLLLTLLVTLVLSCVSAKETLPQVKTPVGTFRGKILTSNSGAEYESYRGIPYALPPTGERRFALPECYPVIKGVYDATEFGSICLQHADGAVRGKEDCLYLNVYTALGGQETADTDLKKVLVFIHGGAWVIGASNLYLPGDLVTRGDVVVITLNYRLNWLGFFRGNSSSLPGNQGFHDQLLALKWVKDNIRHFGGDPSDVTLSGESAGSVSTSLLSVSPLAKGLFSKAIQLSGSIFDFTAPPHTSNDLLQIAANKFGCGVDSVTGNEDDVVACLKRLPVENFVLDFDFPIMLFLSSGDDLLPRPSSEVPSDPQYLSDVGFYSRDYVISVTADDGYIFVNSKFGVIDTSSLDTSVRDGTRVFHLPERVLESVLLEYEKLFGQLDKAVINLGTDIIFLRASITLLEAYSNSQKQDGSSTYHNAYLMSFDHTPRYVPNQYMLHALELTYLFDLKPKDLVESFYLLEVEDAFYEEDVEMKAQFIDLVTSFMKTRNPGKNLATNKAVAWPPYEPKKKSYLSFSLHPSIHEDIFKDKWHIWENLVPQWLQEEALSGNKQEL